MACFFGRLGLELALRIHLYPRSARITDMLPLYLVAMDLSSGPHIWSAGALSTELSPQLPSLNGSYLGKLYSKNGNIYAHYLFRYVQTGQMARLYFF